MAVCRYALRPRGAPRARFRGAKAESRRIGGRGKAGVEDVDHILVLRGGVRQQRGDARRGSRARTCRWWQRGRVRAWQSSLRSLVNGHRVRRVADKSRAMRGGGVLQGVAARPQGVCRLRRGPCARGGRGRASSACGPRRRARVQGKIGDKRRQRRLAGDARRSPAPAGRRTAIPGAPWGSPRTARAGPSRPWRQGRSPGRARCRRTATRLAQRRGLPPHLRLQIAVAHQQQARVRAGLEDVRKHFQQEAVVLLAVEAPHVADHQRAFLECPACPRLRARGGVEARSGGCPRRWAAP